MIPPELEAELAALEPEPGSRCAACGTPAVRWPDYADGRAVLCVPHVRERIARWLDAEFRPVDAEMADGTGLERGADA